jgi:hypothetical protein
MHAEQQPTCGQGVAANADLPATLARLLAAQADVLERHARAIDLSDPAGRGELEAYTSLVGEQRSIARQLSRLAQQMAGYRDLPMPAHDMAVMTDPGGQMEAFGRFTAYQQELVELLLARLSGPEA